MRNAILPVLLSLSLISVKEKNVAGQGVESRPLSRHLMEDLLAKRHTHPIPDHVADPTYPKSIWSEFMLSPCRPEDSGHFGSTFGTPILLQYGFEMETSNFPNIEKSLKIIDEKVMDALLSTFFPTICGFDGSQTTTANPPPQRNLADPVKRFEFDAEITGFRFSKELIDMTRSCPPSMDKGHYCGVFYSNVWVYGHKLNLAPGQVLREARDAVNAALVTVSNLGVVRLLAAENMSGQIQDGLQTSTSDEYQEEIAIGALSGLVISSMALVLGVSVLVLYFRADRSKYQRVSRNGNGSYKMHKAVALSDDDMTPTVTSFGSFRFFSQNGTHADEDNDGDAESEISSVVVDPKLGTYRKMECDKKVAITFDPACCSARSTTGSDVSSIAPDYLDADGRYSGF